MANIDEQKQIRVKRIDVPYCISIAQRYQLNPGMFQEIPVGQLTLVPAIRKKCYVAGLWRLDQLLDQSPAQLITEHGFSLEVLLELERGIKAFLEDYRKRELERAERNRLEAERLERERLEAERLERERLEAERLERERLEAERREQERLEAERREQERLEAERRERERLEAERLERERLEVERLDQKQLDEELRAWENSSAKVKYTYFNSNDHIAEEKIVEERTMPARTHEEIDCTEEGRTLAELFDLLPARFNGVEILSLELSVRLTNVCRRNQIFTVADLLEKTPLQLMEMKNYGKTCMREVERLIADIQSGRIHPEAKETGAVQKKETIEQGLITDYARRIASGEFSFFEEALSDDERKLLVPYLEGYDLLGTELVAKCINAPDAVRLLISAFAAFGEHAQQQRRLHDCLEKIPRERWETKASTYIKVYGKHESLLYDVYPEENAVLEDVLKKDILSEEQIGLVVSFLTWCAFDISQEIELLLASAYKAGTGKQDERRKEVICLRAQKQTLEQIGQKFDVTRERVRQIEGKAVRLFQQKQSRVKLISKINAIKNDASVVTSADLAEYTEGNLQELLFLLRSSKSSDYIYDKNMDIFIVGNDMLQDRIQAFVEQLPDQIAEKTLPTVYKQAEEDYELTAEVVDKAIDEVYKKTGGVYHRSRLLRAEIYKEILKAYYPNGLHVYDPKEIERFRGIVAENYGDIKISEGDRALAARITDVCILCGKGRYRLKKKQYMPKALVERIRSYIDNSDYSIFMTNTIFDAFEADLLAAGVDNKYYLQGILHELFEDQYTFTRDYISKDPGITSVYSSIVNFIKKSHHPVSKQAIQDEFPGVGEISINIATTDSEIINYFGEYLHASYLKVSEAEKVYLKETLERVLADGSAHHVKDLHRRIMQERPEILARNGAIYPFHAYSVLEYLFREEFEFQRPCIAPLGVEIERLTKRLHDFVYTKNEVQVTEIKEFTQENRGFIISTLEFINSCNDRFLLVNNKLLMAIENLGIDESVAKIVEELVLQEISQTMPIRDLACWSKLPAIMVPWTDWLVYSVLYKWSTRVEVAASNPQFRFAIPLVSPAGKMQTEQFFEAYKDMVYDTEIAAPVTVDNLDKIDDLLTELLGEQLLEDELWD